MRNIIFDTETTGFDAEGKDRLVEIGAVEMLNGALTGNTFHVYVNPERDMPEAAYKVHKLSAEFLSDKPLFADARVGPAFVEFIGQASLIAHNASFDIGFMNAELKRAGLPRLQNEVIDTLAIAKKRFPGSPASLDALCARFSIDTTQRERDGHGALLDSRLLAEVYIELTGGAQAGLAFDRNAEFGSQIDESVFADRPTRAGVRPVLLTDAEKSAHEEFVSEMPNSLWQK